MRFNSIFAILLFAAQGCGGGDSDPGADADPAALEPPPECALDVPDPTWTEPPQDQLGGDVGDFIDDFDSSITTCDGTPLSLYDVISQAELTLISIGAGWCEPCITESQTLDSEVFRNFCPRGLRVIQVLFEDEESRPATKLFCNEWKQRYNLSFPVAVDPLFSTMSFFDSIQAQTPMNFLVDGDGKIVFKETGTPGVDLPDRIDALLP